MMTGFFPVVGVMLTVMGLILLLRATGLVNRTSPLFRYRIRIGGLLVSVGVIIILLSIIF